MVDFKPIIPMEAEEPSAPDWMCYDCGSTLGFLSRQDEWTLEWDVTCNMCGSDNTGSHDDGRTDDCPLCEELNEGNENCPVCDGYASTHPYMVDQYKKATSDAEEFAQALKDRGMIVDFERRGLDMIVQPKMPLTKFSISLNVPEEPDES